MAHLTAHLIAFVVVSALCGCKPSNQPIVAQPSNDQPRAVDSSSPTSAFDMNETKGVVSLDTRIAPRQRRRFDLGLGSITLETLHVTDNELTFRYTPEVEGGYTIYECKVPVSPVPVHIMVGRDGTPGATSFDLSACQVIRRGNVFLDMQSK